MSGWLHGSKVNGHCWDGIQLVSPSTKAEVLVAQSKVFEWAIDMLRQLVASKQVDKSLNKMTMQEPVRGCHRRLPWTRFVIAMLGLISGELRAPELGLLINSGLLTLLQNLLKQTGQPNAPLPANKDVWTIYDDTALRMRPSPSWLYGPELASMLKIGNALISFHRRELRNNKKNNWKNIDKNTG